MLSAMIELTTQEEHNLTDAFWKAAEGIKDTRKVLTRIGDRLGLKWQPKNANHIRDMAGFIADNVSLRSESDHVARHFTEDSYWKE